MKALKFTKVQKEQLFLKIARSTPYFPHHCVDVAYILSKYMEDNDIPYEVRLYRKKAHNDSMKKCNHYVVYSLGQIYDFSLCQFYINHKLSKSILKNISDEEFIDTYLYEYQNGQVVFSEEEYNKRFTRLDNESYTIKTETRYMTVKEFVHSFFKERKWHVRSVNKLISLLNTSPDILCK